MKYLLGLLAVSCLMLAGCGKSADQSAATSGGASSIQSEPSNSNTTTASPEAPEESGTSSAEAAADSSDRLPGATGVVPLTPENTKIEFEGTHVGEKPDPRVGSFERFSGQATTDPSTKTLQSVAVEIETASLTTQFPKLTTHLNSPDFFDTRENPSLKFESTSITTGEDGKSIIKGNLTLLKATKEISFPASVELNESGLSLQAEFAILRADFGMDRLQDKVENEVKLHVTVGKPSEK